ncbi:hypothetical protein AUJ63_05190 [Candidatus Pacearchaeota archaeon CG1_02_35_32]|nr:MAG: hypothetical protein AUJ63_05190 [Candidatus Pacearchaeota archaeon CG1_02_35_32]
MDIHCENCFFWKRVKWSNTKGKCFITGNYSAEHFLCYVNRKRLKELKRHERICIKNGEKKGNVRVKQNRIERSNEGNCF